MNEHALIEAVKAAATKEELEALVRQELGIELDKRRSLETLRADILAGLSAEPAPDLQPLPDLPPLEDNAPDPEPEPPRNRLLRNRENGREFIWTPELAKLAHMEEV